MTRAATFRQADATRAMKAAVKAGLMPSECVFERNGEIRLIFPDASPSAASNPLDRVLRK